MKTSLILPFAGQSCRFPGYPPKWRIRHPNGNLMLTESVKRLNLDNVSTIYGGFLLEHLVEPKELHEFCDIVSPDNPHRTIFHGIDKPTGSQPETVYKVIKFFDIKGPIFIKDCDNQFQARVPIGNCACVMDGLVAQNVETYNKSHVDLNVHGEIGIFAERSRIGRNFCCGGYSFYSAEDYCKYYELLQYRNGSMYISNIINLMIDDGVSFFPFLVHEFEDWGTISAWEGYLRRLSRCEP